jgi:hypothetical protein
MEVVEAMNEIVSEWCRVHPGVSLSVHKKAKGEFRVLLLTSSECTLRFCVDFKLTKNQVMSREDLIGFFDSVHEQAIASLGDCTMHPEERNEVADKMLDAIAAMDLPAGADVLVYTAQTTTPRMRTGSLVLKVGYKNPKTKKISYCEDLLIVEPEDAAALVSDEAGMELIGKRIVTMVIRKREKVNPQN